MRLTVLHADLGSPRSTDLEVVPGTAAGLLRQEVARLTGGHEWASAHCRPTADGTPLDDSHPAGLAPLLPGAVLSASGARTAPAERRALTCPRHLAVVAGPDAGSLLPLEGTAEVRVGPDERLRVRDETWGTTRLRVRRRARLRPGRRLPAGHEPQQVVLVRATGAARIVRPTRDGRGGGRHRPVPRRRWRRWPLGAEVQVGATVLVLRDARPLLVAAPRPAGGEVRTRSVVGRRDRARPGAQRAATAVPMLGTLITGLVLAIAVHQPLLLLTGLTGPLLWWANRRSGPLPPSSTPTTERASVPDVAALRLVTARGAQEVDDVHVPVPWDSGGCVAVVGPHPLAEAVARGIVLAELGSAGAGAVAVQTRHTSEWRWLVWTAVSCAGLRAAADPGPPEPALVVADCPEDEAAVSRWRAGSPAAQRLVWVAGDARGVPSWCRNVLTVGPAGAQLAREGAAPQPVRLVGVQRDVAEAQARALARSRPSTLGATEHTDGRVPIESCPDDVLLGTLPGVPVAQATAVAAAWAAPPHGLSSPLGLGPDGTPAVVDLVRDGPHAVVAGTTGAGKSELLTTLVLGLALTYPPQRLALLLVDFKGGTGLPGLAGLPHVVGRLSDLDAAGARRVLLGLGAELRRRERLVAAAGARELDELSGTVGAGGSPVPARLLVVIDEFRALADDLPELLPGLARLAAQGRSLGVHLVLATQRPAGAVPAELRANVSLRVALRVLDPADSTDLVGVPDAARIDARTPGRAVLLRGGGTPAPVQVARAGLGGTHAPVRLARPAADLLGDRAGPSWTPASRAVRPGADAVGRWVAAARAAAVDLPPPDIPWLPELPTHVTADEVPAGAGLPLGVADLPDEQRRAAVRWDPDSGHLLVLGGPRSGRTTALVAAGRHALASGRAVHAVGLPPAAARALGAGAPRQLGSMVAATDVVTVARLLEILTGTAKAGPRPVLLIDQLDLVIERLSTLARGAAADRLTALWERSGPPVALVVSGPVSSGSSRLLGSFADRLVLGVADPALDALAGVPTVFAGPRATPGRAVHLRAGSAVLCQLALPAEQPQVDEPAGAASARDAPPRLRPLPAAAFAAAPRARLGADGRVQIPVGLGGDDGGPVEVDLVDSLLVVGPPGSGRSTAVSAVSTMVASLGVQVLSLGAARGADAAGAGAGAGATVRVTTAQLSALLADGSELVLLLDDLDELERSEPTAMQAVAERLAAQRVDGDRPSLRVVAATTTSHAAASFRGLVPVLLRGRRVLALDLREPGSVELLGPRAAWLADPAGGPPGRGAVRTDSRVLPVQLWASSAGGPAQPGC